MCKLTSHTILAVKIVFLRCDFIHFLTYPYINANIMSIDSRTFIALELSICFYVRTVCLLSWIAYFHHVHCVPLYPVKKKKKKRGKNAKSQNGWGCKFDINLYF